MLCAVLWDSCAQFRIYVLLKVVPLFLDHLIYMNSSRAHIYDFTTSELIAAYCGKQSKLYPELQSVIIQMR